MVTAAVVDATPAVTARSRRIQIVDDHPVFAELLGRAVSSEADFDYVGAASSTASAIELARRERPALIVMDIELGPEDGLDACQVLADLFPQVVLVVVSAHRDSLYVARAAHAGANAFVPKSGSLPELLAVLRAARRGPMLLAPSLRHDVPSGPIQAGGQVDALTVRERDVLMLMGRGLAPSAIAKVLSISVNTCRGYVKSIFTKLAVRSQLEAVVKGQRLGLLDLAEPPGDRRADACDKFATPVLR